MKVPALEIRGTVLVKDGRGWLVLDEAAETLWLRFALPERETDYLIFPESVLDDWGAEIKGLELYDWLMENGPQFPRAEVFGVNLAGKAEQRFVRELDLVTRFPCYAYTEKNAPLQTGVQVEAFVVSNQAAGALQRIKRPADLASPLDHARGSWWEGGWTVGL